ncbi:MAG: GAF domain-containing protein [Rubripirellula sp.]
MSTATQQPTQSSILDVIFSLSSKIVQGATLEESLEFVFDNFAEVVPYDRIGFAEVNVEKQTVHTRWARSHGKTLLGLGFSAPLSGSSLSIVLQHRQPRVLNNLPTYLEHRPKSHSTRLIVREGVRSSMTCPLFVNDQPFGFLFFSSFEVDAYEDLHVKILKEVGNQLAMLLMASKVVPTVKTVPIERPTANPIQRRPKTAKPATMMLSSLRPGMILDSPITFSDGRLLLSAGVELTQQSINRLVTLHTQGFMSLNAIKIR